MFFFPRTHAGCESPHLVRSDGWAALPGRSHAATYGQVFINNPQTGTSHEAKLRVGFSRDSLYSVLTFHFMYGTHRGLNGLQEAAGEVGGVQQTPDNHYH